MIEMFSALFNDFWVRALLAGLALSSIAGPVGAFVVWRRYAYLGDTLAHGALLGLVLAAQLALLPLYGILLVSFAIAFILYLFEQDKRIPSDTVLGILAHGSLAIGLLAVSLNPSLRRELLSVLYGDILAVTSQDVVLMLGLAVIGLSLIVVYWRQLLAITVHRDLAIVEGIPVKRFDAMLLVLLVLVVAMAIKGVGVLLTTALLIMPVAIARQFFSRASWVTQGASIAGMLAVASGLYTSAWIDVPSGPLIVSLLVVFFLIAAGAMGIYRRFGSLH